MPISAKQSMEGGLMLRGPQGEQGIQGPQGEQGPKGDTGEKGSDGISVTHKWSGTILEITSASGTSSVDLKGEKGDKGETGPQGEQGGVKTVNGVAPDDTGDVKIDVPESFSGSWNDLSDKPFEKETVKSRTLFAEENCTFHSPREAYLTSISLWSLDGKDVVVDIDGVEYESVCAFSPDAGAYIIELGGEFTRISEGVSNDYPVLDSSNELLGNTYSVKIYTVEKKTTFGILDDRINELINNALGVIENGTY